MASKIEFYRHNLGDEERTAVAHAIDDVFLTTGQRVAQFQEQLAAYLGGDVRALGVSSCTAALHLALLACGVGAGHEVITTPMTFISSASPILYVGATPVFVDVEADTGNIDLERVRAALTPRTRAIIVVHLYGQMCDVRGLRELCDRHGLSLIEDAAHALEAVRDGARPGHLGDAACFSFHAVKSITSAEGGAFVTRHPELLERARRLSSHGLSADAARRHGGTYVPWDMLELGFKYNMTNLEAALLSPQLARVGERHRARARLSLAYERAFAGVDGIEFPAHAGGVSARQMFTIWVPRDRRDRYLTELGQRGIGVGVHYRPVHLTSYYRERFGFRGGELPVAESIGARTISLPLYPRLGDDEQKRVIDEVLAVHGAS